MIQRPMTTSLKISSLMVVVLVALDFATVSRVNSADQAASDLQIGGAKIEVTVASGPIDLPRPRVMKWISAAANAVAAYYGHFPITHERILIVPVGDRHGVLSGTTWGYGVARTRILLGQSTTADELDRDWIMTHELVHLAFPRMPENQHWIEEGIATYVEPIARARLGQLDVRQVWGDMVDGMPKGLPQPGDRGLDRTPTWGRTYWGGALFCLLADVRIRQRTRNQHGLEDALRAIVAAGGNMETEWRIRRAFKVGDDATGVPVLLELYDQMKDAPISIDLPALWRELGVEQRGREVIFDDRAPLAGVRRAITAHVDTAG